MFQRATYVNEHRKTPLWNKEIYCLVNETNRCTEFQFYWYYDSTCFGQSFCSPSGVFSRTLALVQFMQFGDWVMPGAGWNSVTKLHKLYQCHCMAKNSWWWAERLPKTCRVVIPIKLELSASVGFIHKESITMHGHTVLKVLKFTAFWRHAA
jgi:hypothetical protein